MATLKSRELIAQRQAEGAKSARQRPTDPASWEEILKKKHERLGKKDPISFAQNPLGVLGGVVSDTVQTVLSGEVLSGTGLDLSSGALQFTKLWRYKLLMKGANGMEKTQWSPRPTIAGLITDSLPNFLKGSEPNSANYHTTRPLHLSKAEQDYPGNEPNKILARRMATQGDVFTPAGKNYIKNKLDALESFNRQRKKNTISIINASVSPYQALTLQNRPNEVNIDPKSSWAVVNSMGRNDPFLMYTGGETTISFEVQWFANDPERRDEVLWKCRLLESWSRADGYLASPPLLYIVWGSSDIFSSMNGEAMTQDTFILESAKYTLTHFQDFSRSAPAKHTGPVQDLNNEYAGLVDGQIDLKLNPNCATQTLVFKRVAQENRTHESIAPASKLTGIRGIETLS